MEPRRNSQHVLFYRNLDEMSVGSLPAVKRHTKKIMLACKDTKNVVKPDQDLDDQLIAGKNIFVG